MSEDKNKLMRQPDQGWKPVNTQASMITRPAKDLERAPEEKRFAETTEEIVNRQRKAIQDNIKRIEAIPKKEPKQKKVKAKRGKCLWAAKLAKRLAKQKGLPPPTAEELRDIRRSQAGFDETI